MSDLEKALAIFERKFGKIKNIKFLLTNGMEVDAVAADFLALARDTNAGTLTVHESYPEPELAN